MANGKKELDEDTEHTILCVCAWKRAHIHAEVNICSNNNERETISKTENCYMAAATGKNNQ